MDEREYQRDRSMENDQSSPEPIISYEREMYGGTPRYNDDGTQYLTHIYQAAKSEYTKIGRTLSISETPWIRSM